MSTATKIFGRLLVTVVFLASLSACGGAKYPSIEGQERDQVLSYSEPAADHIFQAITDGDYGAFTQDFDAAMLKATSQDNFDKLRETLSQKMGRYVSRSVIAVYQTGADSATVVYDVKFTEKDQVKSTLTLHTGGDHKVAGFYIYP